MASLWAVDPDPARTLAIQADIDAAVAAGAVTRLRDNGTDSYYFCCPWAPIYQIRTTATIAGTVLVAPQQFTFDVSGEEITEGGAFVRRIILGPFRTTTDVDYRDPAAGGHDD